MTEENIIIEPQADEPILPPPPTDPTAEEPVPHEDPTLQEEKEKELTPENDQVDEPNDEPEANPATLEAAEANQNQNHPEIELSPAPTTVFSPPSYSSVLPQPPPQFDDKMGETNPDDGDDDGGDADVKPPVLVEPQHVDKEEKEEEMVKVEEQPAFPEPPQFQVSIPQETEKLIDDGAKTVPSVETKFYLVGNPNGINKRKTTKALEKAYGKIPELKVGKHDNYLIVSVPVPEGHGILIAIDEGHKITIQDREFTFSSVIPEPPKKPVQIPLERKEEETMEDEDEERARKDAMDEEEDEEKARKDAMKEEEEEEKARKDAMKEEEEEERARKDAMKEEEEEEEKARKDAMKEEEKREVEIVPEGKDTLGEKKKKRKRKAKKEEVVEREEEDERRVMAENENDDNTDTTNSNDDDDDDDEVILNPPTFPQATPKESENDEKPPMFPQATPKEDDDGDKPPMFPQTTPKEDDDGDKPPMFPQATPKESENDEKPPMFPQETSKSPSFQQQNSQEIAGAAKKKKAKEDKDKHSEYPFTFYVILKAKVNKISNKFVNDALMTEFKNIAIKKVICNNNHYVLSIFILAESNIIQAVANNYPMTINGNSVYLSANPPEEPIPVPPQVKPPVPPPPFNQAPPVRNTRPHSPVQPPRRGPSPPPIGAYTITYTFRQIDGNTGSGFDTSLISSYLTEQKFSVDVSPASIQEYRYCGFPYYSFDVPYNPADESALNLGVKFKLSDRTFVIRKDMDVFILVEKRSIDDVTSFIKANDVRQVIRGNRLHPSTQLALIYQIVYDLPNDLDTRMRWLRELINNSFKWVSADVYWDVFNRKITPLIQKRLVTYKGALDELMKIIATKTHPQGKQQ